MKKDSSRFIRYRYSPGKEGNSVRCIVGDETGLIWFGLMDTLFSLQPYSKIIESYSLPRLPIKEDNSENLIRVIFYDSKEQCVWVGTSYNGVFLFDNYDKDFVSHFKYNQSHTRGLSHNKISAFLKDDFDNLWVGTYGGGLNFISSNRKSTQHFKVDIFNPAHQNFSVVRTMLRDRAGNYWLGTFYGGVKVLLKNSKPFTNYTAVPGKPNGLLSNQIGVLTEHSDGKIWAPTEGKGLTSFDPISETFKYFQYQNKSQDSIDLNNIVSVIEDDDGTSWAITFNEIWKLDDKTKQWKGLKPTGMPRKDIWLLIQHIDSKGTHWIGSQDGLFSYDHNKNTLIRHSLEAKKTGYEHGDNNYVEGFFESKNGDLWIATHGGVNRLRKTDRQTIFYPFNQQALCIRQDKKGTLWIGTISGLAYLSPSGNIEFHPKAKSILGKLVHAILDDDQGRLWISSSAGIFCFNPYTGITREYNQSDGLINRQFLGTNLKHQSGEFYFGGTKGLLRFHPDSIHENLFIPPIVLTNFQILNRDIPIRGSPGDTLSWESPLEQSISYTDKIVLQYWQNDFAFEFAALDFTAPLNNYYKFQLIGYDNSPVETKADRRFAHYSNIAPGTYTFSVTGSNNDKTWNEEGVFITIIILPPWWKTWWAYLLYTLFFIGLLLGIRRYELNRQLTKSEARRLEELDSIKTRLYTNITHEFRTPLTIILGLAEHLKSQASESLKSGLDTIRRNGQRLLYLVNQMLDLSKAESGQLKMVLIQSDIVNYMKYLLESFQSIATGRKINLIFQSDLKELVIDYDPERLQTVVSNLLSNAIKFTPNGGSVILQLEQIIKVNTSELSLSITDTGPGIPEDKLPYVFDRFYQIDDSTIRASEGTGIGLALTRELVKLMNGNITVVTDLGKGTTFTVSFPVTRSGPIAKTEMRNLSTEPNSSTDILKPILQLPKSGIIPSKISPLILIIEDNPDVVLYLQTCLQNNYRTDTAYDGNQGIEKAQIVVPDLIVCDVMMPNKDGFEVCQALKADARTSHIPIILLTAKADIESRLVGLRRGADDYLAKPFYKQELLTRINNLLMQRRLLQAHYLALAGGQVSNLTGQDAPGSLDINMEDAFIRRVKGIIEEDFSRQWQATEIARSLHVSESQLYRKLQALTNMHITEFIRFVRLSKARQLLREQPNETISAIAYDVGFHNAQEFSRRFKELFSMTPSDWRKGEVD
ncbi:MAG: response regulator [Saprospiraceae bacterium]|nr:response regulator [Saprospiraceae bacterium]